MIDSFEIPDRNDAIKFAVSKLQKNDEILISHMEHHANIVPWQQLAKRIGAKLRYLPLTKSGDIDLTNSK